MSTILPSADAFRRAGWLHASPQEHKNWLNRKKEEVHGKALALKEYRCAIKAYATTNERAKISRPDLLPSVQEFADYIESDPTVYLEFNRMFDGVTDGPKDSDDLIALYDEIFRKSPDFTLNGPPVYGAMHFVMNTQGGFSAFTKEKLNEHYTKMMKTWVKFLDTPKSLEYPNIDHTWLNDDARRYLTSKFFVLAPDGITKIQTPFEDVFICNPAKPHFGFTSYENFFNRRLRNPERDRPVEDINNLSLVSAPCESTVFAVQYNVKAIDELFIKGEAYSLHHLLCGHNVPLFEGGTAFQTFLQTTDYHRWHVPVNGIVEKIIHVPGTFFAQAPSTIGGPLPLSYSQEEEAPPYLRSLRFFANTATRLLIFIKADNPCVGLMCFVAIGMTEISSCEPTVREGQRVKRGEELGMFHFGGSSSLLLFNKESDFKPYDNFIATPGHRDIDVYINQTIGTVKPPISNGNQPPRLASALISSLPNIFGFWSYTKQTHSLLNEVDAS